MGFETASNVGQLWAVSSLFALVLKQGLMMMRLSGLKGALKIESLSTLILPTSSLKSLLPLRLLFMDCNPQNMELCSP